MANDPASEAAAIIAQLATLGGRGGLAPSSSNHAVKVMRLDKALFSQPDSHAPPEGRPSKTLEVFRETAGELSTDLTPYGTASTASIVADTVFALGLFAETYRGNGIDGDLVRQLYDGDLGDRRGFLVRHWRTWHLAVDGVSPPKVPTVGTLRKSLEKAILADLADRLAAAVRQEAEGSAVRNSGSRRPRIAVVGGATTDLTLSVESIPAEETSSQATRTRYSPGGKGLLQAVAAARLDASSTLIAAVADDLHGRRIIDALEKEKVDTAGVKLVPGADAAITCVIEDQEGASLAVSSRGEATLEPADILRVADLLGRQDALLVTFEMPATTLKCLLGLAELQQVRRPVVVLTPGQPYPSTVGLDRRILRNVDCIVARPWELARLFKQRDLGDDQLVDYFLQAGVKVVCLMDRQGCTVHCADDRSIFQAVISPQIPRNSAVARDAFCAALAVCLGSDRDVGWREAVEWATAAMARTAQQYADLVEPAPDPADNQSVGTHNQGQNLSIDSLPNRDLVNSRLPAVDIRGAERPLSTAVAG
ncbi:PfkB family carbohydrate kinase [Kribbella sp. DT2]|uniref:PfkB family carbohydrate kinase n=1 Tax=Kribbella sp. DT2 TaxID=3393427 RepID=UPI003CEE1FD5